jgi:hypothetical protein
MKIPSFVLLPWWEEEVEEGEHSPLTSILSHGGERIEVSFIERGMTGDAPRQGVPFDKLRTGTFFEKQGTKHHRSW